MRPNLLIAGIINIISGLAWVGIGNVENNFTLAVGAFVIVTGIIFITYSRMQINEVISKKNTILTLAIFTFPFSFIASIVSFVEYDLLKRDYAKYKIANNIQNDENVNTNNKVNKENRKVDILLKIGVTMIGLAGAMIVTTSWETITATIKLLLLVLLAFVFLGLAIFSKYKLQIRNTTIAYWLLSMIAFGLSAFLIGYEQMIGEWFSIGGDGELIFFAALSLTVCILSYITYKEFDITGFLYLSYLAMLFGVLFLLMQMQQEQKNYILIIASILLFINILPKFGAKEFKVVKKFSMVITYIITAFILVELKDIKNDVIIAITFLVQIVSLIALGITEKSDTSKIASSLCVLILTLVSTHYVMQDIDEINKLIITRSIFIIASVLICAFLIRNPKSGSVFMGIILPIALLSIMGEVNVVIAIYVGCVSIIMIIFGLINKNYKVVYIEGIVFTILNLGIQLYDLWGEIPAWVYLLIGGFILIGIVTIKELRKGNSSDKQPVIEENKTTANQILENKVNVNEEITSSDNINIDSLPTNDNNSDNN